MTQATTPKIEPVEFFDTPQTMNDLMDRLENWTGSERAVAMTAAMLAWNLACKITNPEKETI